MRIISYNAKKQTAEIEWMGNVRVISEEAALLARIDIKNDIPEEAIPSLLSASEEILCRKYLYEQISKYSKTKRGYLNKLLEKGFSKGAAKDAVERAENYGYIDDAKYAERYISLNSSKKGYYRLKQELLNKGIPSAIVADVLSALPPQEEEIISLAQQLVKKPLENGEDRAKLARKLAARGFPYEDIRRAINALRTSNDDFDD